MSHIGRERGVKLPRVHCGRQQGNESHSRDSQRKVSSNAFLSTLACELSQPDPAEAIAESGTENRSFRSAIGTIQRGLRHAS
jgi:hypothetical protein